MESESADPQAEARGLPLDIDNVHMLLQVEQEQIQKRTFTNWINAQLAKRKPPCVVRDLFHDVRDGSLLLDLLEVMSGQHMSRERGRGIFQHRSNIESALSFLRRKSIKLININIPDIIDGKPSIVLGLIWTIILHFHIEELACALSFSSRQSSLESLASLDTCSTGSRSSSRRSSPLPRRGSPLHQRFRISAKKALMLWVREQLQKAGCTLNVKDFKTSWRSGVVFLAILCGLRPDLVDLSKAKNRSNKQNLEEAFRIAEQELRIPRLLAPEDVDVRDPDEKSIMTYVAQFLQYSQDMPASEEEMQVQYMTSSQRFSPVNLPTHYTPAISASPLRQAHLLHPTPMRAAPYQKPEPSRSSSSVTSANQKAREVTCWLEQAYQELVEGWDSTEGESYAERYHVFQTFVVSFNEQRRPVMPLLTAMRRTPQLSEEQRALRGAWDSLAEKLREYKSVLDLSLPAPLDAVGRWLLRVEGALTDEDKDTQDHTRAAEGAREKLELLKTSMEEMGHHLKIFNSFKNMDEYGAILVPTDKMEEIKRRFTSVRVTAKYHGIKLEYQEHWHTVLDLLGQLNSKLCSWKRPYCSQEGVRVLLQDWHEAVDKQDLVSLLEAALLRLKLVAGKYTSKSALAADSQQVTQQMKDLEGRSAVCLEAVSVVKSTMNRVLSAWDSYCDCLSSLQAWLAQESQSHSHRAEVASECMSKWSSCQAHLNEVGNFLTEVTSPQTSRALADEMRKVNMHWADFVKRTTFDGASRPPASPHSPQAVQALCREASQLLKEPVEALSGPLRTYRKRLQFMMEKINDVDVDSLAQFPDCSAETLHKLRHTLPEVVKTLHGAEQVCEELQQSVSSLDGRLAELQHCETEARELYQLLKEEWKYGQSQDPRARMFISRALQLEGQVVTEEQDLQVMVMTGQKNSPLQYLIASGMQDRVRAAVAHSQEAVGMLSSLGARRDRSPTEDQPPPKIFIQSYTEDVPQTQADMKFHAATEIRVMSTETQSLDEPQDMPEPHPQEEPLPQELPPSLAQPEPLVQHQPPAHPQPLTKHHPQPSLHSPMQTQPQALAQPGALAELQALSQPQTQHQSQPQACSHPQGEMHPQPVPQVHIQHYLESQPPLQTFTYAQAVTHSLPKPQSQSDPQVETHPQTHATIHALVHAQAVSKPLSYTEDPVQPDTKAPVQPVLQTQPHVITLDKTHSQTQVKPHVLTQAGDQHFPQAVLESSVPDYHSQISAQSQAQKLQARAKNRPWMQKKTQTQAWTHTTAVPEEKIQHQPLFHTQIQVQAPPKAQGKIQTQPQVHVQPEAQVQVQPQAHVQAHSLARVQVHPNAQVQVQTLQGHVQTQPQAQIHDQPKAQVWAQPHSQFQAQPQAHVQAHTQTQVQVHPKAQVQVQPQAHVPAHSQAQVQFHPKAQVQVQTQGHFQAQPQVRIQPQAQVHSQTQAQVRAPLQAQVHVQPQAQVHAQTQAQVRAPLQAQVHVQPQAQVQAQPKVQVQAQSKVQAKDRPQAQVHAQPQTQVLTPCQAQVHVQPQVQIQAQPKDHIQAQTQAQFQAQPQDQVSAQPQANTQAQPQTQLQVQPQAQTQAQASVQPQPWSHSQTEVQVKPKVQAQAQVQVQPQSWAHPQTEVQIQSKAQPLVYTQNQVQYHPQAQAKIQPQPWVHTRTQGLPQVYPLTAPEIQAETKVQTHPQIQPKPLTQTQAQSQIQPQQGSQSQAHTQAQPEPWTPTEIKTFPRTYPPTHRQIQPQTWVQSQDQAQSQAKTQGHVQVQPQPQAKSQAHVQVQAQPEAKTQAQVQAQTQPQAQPQAQAVPRTKAPALAQAPPQAYTEAYSKAQALARDRFEDAKHCLQDHILEAITIFHDTQISEEEMERKEETLKALDPELLEEFLRAAEGMEAFCTVAQLRDLEFFTESVRTQWETCFSSEGSLLLAGRQLEALKELCDTLSPEDAHRLAQAQLQECERRLAAIQRQFSGDRDSLPGHPVELAKDRAEHRETAMLLDAPRDKASPQVTQVIIGADTVEVKKVEKIVIEDDPAKREALARYQDSRITFQAQLAKNKQSLQSFPSEVVTPADLHTQLQDLEALQKETEQLWCEFALQGTQCSKFKGEEHRLVQDKTELMQEWQRQQICLQGRIKSLQTAVGLIDPREEQIRHISERLDNYIKKPKDVTAFSLTDANCLQDIKDLEEDIQQEMDQLSGLAHEDSPALGELDPEDRLPLSRAAQGCQHALDQLRQQGKKSEAATRALDRFLMSLRTVEQDVGGTRAAPCEDAEVLRDCRSRLAHIRQSVRSMADKAPQLDRLLEGAGLCVTRDGAPASCLDMVSALEERLEEADGGLAGQQEGLQREQETRSLGLRRRTLLGALRELQDAAERQGVREPTLPAVQQRMRALTDVESRLAPHRAELLKLRGASEEGDHALEELESQWEDTQRAVTEGLEQCRVLMELLKKFQNCRSRLSNTLQRAEQTISEQASYMGKDNLQRLIATVDGIKEDLGSLGEGVEEIRGVCRQLQSQLKKIPECADAPFESEADALVDRWLDVTEKTDAHMDNLHVGLELWDKLQLLGGEVDGWMDRKMSMFAERHPFQSEDEVIALQDEIQAQEENIERFHRKSSEIQQLLQTKESPLELQVMESQLRKKMEQVKELFSDNSDVFQELMAVRRHITERISECQSSLQAIESAMSTLSAAENPQLLTQELSERLQSEAEQADSLLKEVSLMGSVASPHALQALMAEGAQLKESVRHAQELISQKKEQVERGLLRAIKDECQAFEEWFQDLQLSVNECFENPEQREDVEASIQRLTQGFLEFKEGERRLDQLKERVAQAGEKLPSEQLEPLGVWLQDQEKELTTFRAHCQDRHSHLEDCLHTLNSLQEEYSHVNTWLQAREHKLAQGEELNHLHEEVLKESERVEGLNSLVVAVRRKGLRSDRLVRESDKLLQRYHSLLARLSSQAEAQSALARETQAFEAQAESTRAWIGDLQQRVHSLGKGTVGTQAEIEDRLQKVQALLSNRYEGESKLQDLRWTAQRLSQQKDLEENRRCGVQQTVRDAEEQWRGVMQSAEELQKRVEDQSALVRETQAFEAQAESTRAWIGDLQQQVHSLDKGTVGTQAEIEDRLQKVQALLSTRYEGESKLQDLGQSGRRLSQQKGLEESRRCGVQQTVSDAEEQWRGVMQSAEELQKQAEAQSTLVRESQAFEAQAESTRAWIGDLQQRVHSLDKGTVGTQAEIEDRLQEVQALLSARGEGESKLQDLRQSGRRLSQQKGLEESRRCGVLQTVRDAEDQWRGVVQSAEELLRMLEGLVERLMSCLCQKQQAQDRVEQLQRQTADLPQRFPWPGLGDRRQAAEHVRNLLNRTRALTPALSDLPARGAELFQLTQDPSWIDPSWGALEKCVPPLLQDLTDACGSLEEGIQTERHCAQLVEQHSAALDWLHEQVQGIGALPSDRAGLQSTINTLKALLQTADREEKEMKELDAVKASLLLLCTPSGQTSLQQEVGRMQERRAHLETEARGRLRECEARLQGLEQQRGERAQRLREEAADLRGDLHRLGQRMDYSKPPADIGHLQDQWNTLKGCERPLEELGLRVQGLQQALGSEVATEALPGDVVSDVAAVAAEHDRLRTRLSERLDSCAQDIMRSLRDSLQALQQWNESAHVQLSSGSSHNTQPVLEEGERLRRALQGALSRGQFLKDSVGLEEMDRLGRDSSDVLRDSGVHISNLTQSLQKGKQEAHEHVSERPTSLAEQQHVLGLLDTQVQKHTPQICHMTEGVDIAGLQAGDMPRADKEKVLSQQDVSLSSRPADVSGRRKAPRDREKRAGLRPDTLRKRDEAAAPDMQQGKSFTAEKEEPGTQRAGAVLFLDTGVQQIQTHGTDTLHVGPLPRENIEYTATGKTEAPSNEIHRTQGLPQDSIETTVTDWRGSETQDPGMSRPDRMDIETRPSKKQDAKMVDTQKHDEREPCESRDTQHVEEVGVCQFPKTPSQLNEMQQPDKPKGFNAGNSVMLSLDTKTEHPNVPDTYNDREERERMPTVQSKKMATVVLDADTLHIQTPEPWQSKSSDSLRIVSSETGGFDTKWTPSQTLEAKTQPSDIKEHEEAMSGDTVKYTLSSPSSAAPHKAAQDRAMQPADGKQPSKAELSFVHHLRMMLDTESLKEEEPHPVQPLPGEKGADKINQEESTLTRLPEPVQGGATEPSQIRSTDNLCSPDTQEIQRRYLVLNLPEVAEVQKVTEKPGSLLMEVQIHIDQPRGPKAEFSESTQLDRGEGSRVIPTDTAQLDREKGIKVIPMDTAQLERETSNRVTPTDTAQLEREKDNRMIPTDTAQLEREESVRIMQTDHTQLEEAKPDTPEVHRPVSDTAVGRTTEPLKREECHSKKIHIQPKPRKKKAVKINQEETTLTRIPEPEQGRATEPSQIRSTDNLCSPDTQEKQRRYLVLDLPEVAEVQKVAAEKPGALHVEVQDHADQTKGPHDEFSESTQIEREQGIRVIPTDTAQLEREKGNRVTPTDTAQLEREKGNRVIPTDTAQLEKEESVRMMQTDHKAAKPDTPKVHRPVSETTVGKTTESLKREEYHSKKIHMQPEPREKEVVKINQDETTLTRLPEPVQGGATEPSPIRSTSPDTQEIQRRYLVLDLPEVAEVQRVAAEKPGALHVEVQDHADQPRGPKAEFSEPTQLDRGEGTRVIPTDTVQLEREKSTRVIPTNTAQLGREESVRMMQTDHKAAKPDTPEVLRPVSETTVGETTEFAERETVKASVPESATGKDRTLEQAKQPEAEREHAETPKTLHPENREAVAQGSGQMKEKVESMRLPLIGTALAEPGLCPSVTPAELSGGRENRNLERIKSPQSEEENTMKQPDSSEAIQEVPEEGASVAGDIRKREDLPLELPHGPSMQETFKEIQQLVETGPDNFVIGGKPLWKPVGSLDTSRKDLDTRLSHVVFRILNSRNRPAQLNTTAMAQQVEEAEDCRQCAQEQLAVFSQMCEDRDSDDAQHVEGQWSAALWDASAAVHAKEAQLQLVALYHEQTLAAKATQEKLEAELDALRALPVGSSAQKAEKLRAVLWDMEQERTVIGELLQTSAKLSPYLSQADRLVARTQLEHLQGEWRALARAAEKALHQVSVQIQESSDLLQEAHELQDQLEALQKSLGPPQLSTEEWDSQRAGQLMIMGSALTAANQHYHHLQQQTSDALFQRFQGEKERRDIEQALHGVKEQVDKLQGQISRQTPSSSNTTLGKIMKVMQEAFTWAKQTESDIEARKKVVLLPEGVHSQIKGLKKLQSEISTKQSQLESFVEEVRELIPDLDEKDTPMVLSSLKTLESLAKSTAEKLARALQDMESGLQAREKMSEQIADVDSWVVAHVHKETIRESISKGNTADLERKLRQLQETLKEADKQAAVTEALLMRSRDIAPELTVIENCRLNDKLISLQEDIKDIISCEKANCQELEKLLQAQDSSRKKLSSVETSLRQMLVDLNRFRFPITRDSLCSVEPIKHMILEQKCQVDQLSHCKEDKRKELLCTIAEIQDKVNSLGQKAEQHERYLNCRQRLEDLKEKVEAQVLKVKDESISKEERFKGCQALLIQLPLIKNLCKVAEVELQNILTDLYPTQLSSERQRLRQVANSFSTLELTVSNDTSILEWALLNSLHCPTEHKAMGEFLKHANRELEQPTPLPLEEQAIDRELLKCATLRRNVESRARVLEAFEPRNGSRQKGQEQKNADLADLRKKTLSGCEMRMENLSQAREMLGDYSRAVGSAVAFLQEAESRLHLPLDYAGSCPEELQRTQQALASLDEQFQSHITQIQALVPQHSCLSSYQTEELHSTVLSQLLVRVSALQAQAQRRMETLQKCSKKQRMYIKCYKEICQRLKTVQASLSDCISYNAISYKACLDQQGKLKALVLEVDSLAGRLEELKEWCSERGCSRGREEAVSTLWRDWARLERCARYLKARSDQKGAEWRDITKSVEKATVILDQLQDELPDCSRETATQEELQEVLACMEQYQDRLDCEHRALTALELRAARLLGVPAHQELSPPIPLCQELQTMQGRYKNLKEKSMLGRQAVQSEVQERERVKEEIGGVKEWLVAAVSLLSVMEDLPSTQELQEVQAQLCSQKAVLQGIMDGLKMKYSDMYTLVPVEIDGPLQEVNRSLQEVEEKVGEAVEKSGPLCRLGGKVEEIRVGLQVVLASLEKRCPSVAEAESRQKRVWDELDRWHSRMAALEVEVHDIADDLPEEAHILTDKLMETLQLYQHVAKQAEQRTAFLSKIHTCLQEHEEMINSSNSWLIEAHAWLTAPCTYTTANCLSSHVNALQMVLDDSEQMRRTLQTFVAVLQEVSSVCDMTAQEEQLAQADQRVASMQQSIAHQLSQFQHAAEEVEAIESEVEKMEKNLNKFRDILSSQDSAPSPPEERCGNMQMILNDIESMKRTMAEIQSCKPGLCLPEEAEESLTIFHRAKLLLQQIQSLEQMIYQQNPTLKVAIEQPVELEELSTSTSEEVIVPSPTLSILEEMQDNDAEVGQIRIVHVEEDVLKRSGASLLTVEVGSSPEQRLSWGSERTTQDPDEIFTGEEQASRPTSDASLEQSLGRDEVFDPQPDSSTKDVVGLSLPTGASETEAHSKPVATVRTQALPQSMVNKSPSVNLSSASSKTQQRCTVS